MNEYHTKRAIEIIKQIQYATIATASKVGKPWNSPVAHEWDSSLNIYWFSDKENQHSKNIRENEDVFIVIYDSTVPEGEGEGVYIEAKATEVNDPDEVTRIRKIKKGESYDRPPSDFLDDAVRRVYKAVPTAIWMNDAEVNDGIFIKDFRVELSLDRTTKLLSS